MRRARMLVAVLATVVSFGTFAADLSALVLVAGTRAVDLDVILGGDPSQVLGTAAV